MNRRWAARIAAPAALLAAVTIAVLLVRAGLEDEPTAVQPQPPPVTATTDAQAPTDTETEPVEEPVFATVEAGDTLLQLASEHETTVERLLELNPGLDPTALQVGQRIRVR